MNINTRKLTLTIMSSAIVIAVSTAVVADVTLRLLTGNNFVVEDRTDGADNLIVHELGTGVEVPRGPLELKDGDASGTGVGMQKIFEGSGGGSDSVTLQAPDDLAADVLYNLPVDDGEPGDFLTTDGSGVLSWTKLAFPDCGGAVDTAIVDLGATTGGRTWMDRNLGASQKATAFDDSLSYGCLFQWGRAGDGHAVRTSATHAGSVASSVPGSGGNAWDGKFIFEDNANNDWLNPTDDTLWGPGTAGGTTPIGDNDPCPTGYQVPNQNELVGLGIIDRADAYNTLALSVGGLRYYLGALGNAGSGGYYWSSTVTGVYSYFLYFRSALAGVRPYGRGIGESVRCIKSL